ncbi:MAG: hypothetical protein JXA13_15225 [Anaerolineales bacterium]|nr:hypothetical protein [Anaerolineales bacterium]
MSETSLLDSYLPVYEFSEFHKIRINAPKEHVFEAIKTLPMVELSPLAHLMFAARELPARLAGKDIPPGQSGRPMLESMFEEGFILLEETPGKEIVFGLIGEFWKPDYGIGPQINSPQEFLVCSDPTFAKVAANLSVSETGAGKAALCTTETRIHTADPATRRKFAAYWRIISIGSSLIRILWLRAIKRRAEKAGYANC